MADHQEKTELLNIDESQAGWDATLQANRDKLSIKLKTYKIEVDSQGNTSTPSEIDIEAESADGKDLEDVYGYSINDWYVRVRVCDSGGYAAATNATIAAKGASNTSLVETITAGKDLVFKTIGKKVEVMLTDATAETVTLRIGPAPLCPLFADYANYLNVAHAAP